MEPTIVTAPEAIHTLDQLDIQECIAAAEQATDELLASGVLDQVPNPPAVIALSRIINNTDSHFDTDLITKKIRVRLTNSGKARISTVTGIGGPEDPVA